MSDWISLTIWHVSRILQNRNNLVLDFSKHSDKICNIPREDFGQKSNCFYRIQMYGIIDLISFSFWPKISWSLESVHWILKLRLASRPNHPGIPNGRVSESINVQMTRVVFFSKRILESILILLEVCRLKRFSKFSHNNVDFHY